MYFLMNKDREIGQFNILHNEIGNSYQFEHTDGNLPVGFKYIDAWLENRKASKDNAHLRKIMKDCGCDTTEGFIKVTHAASINDTFWIKSDKEDVLWKDISFYSNPFDENVSKLAFEGLGLYGIKVTSTLPELSTNGSFRKCWKRDINENGDKQIFLYKGGSVGAGNAGLEPYCEVMSAEIAREILGKDAVPYYLTKFQGKIASKCPLFTNESYGYVPIAKFNINYTSPADLMKFYEKLNSEDTFRKMLVLDAITFNVDRHAGNHGVLVNNDTQKPITMAPVFDLNMSLLPYVIKEEMLNIGDKLEEYGPRIGEDFTRIGQQAMTSETEKILRGLKGFQFSFQGDDTFPKERVKFLETMVNKQIEALLSKEILYTKDVFVPKREHNVEEKADTDFDEKYETLAEKIWNNKEISEWFSMYDIEDNEMILFSKNNPHEEIHLNLDNGETSMYIDGNPIDIGNLVINHEELSKMGDIVQKVYNNLDIEEISKNELEH